MDTSRGAPPNVQIKLSGVISALSYALDITEGQPRGHAARTCMLGMRIARELRLSADEGSALFYALLMKDLGCSNNAGRMCYLFGADDIQAKHDAKTVQWTSTVKSLGYVLRTAGVGRSLLARAARFGHVIARGQRGARELIQLRCERGATISRALDFPEQTGQAILALDEHWDGGGHPLGLRGDQIPMLARIVSLSQTVEVFARQDGLDTAMDVARDRRGTWFDPDLVDIVLSLRSDSAFWDQFRSDAPDVATTAFEPQDRAVLADEARLDQIADGFSQVIDAKSNWTYRHSAGVARIAAGLATTLGFAPQAVRYVHRAALVHDIGKLGVSNMILDKAGKLTPEELAEMRRHPFYTHQILSRVDGFKSLADLAASHHERIDGKGYHRGLTGPQLGPMARVLVVADMFEALTASRPYRKDLSIDTVMGMLRKDVGKAICPAVFEALRRWVATERQTADAPAAASAPAAVGLRLAA
jgi:HD-GYP domain-containing protein (c-di-GMP phosphodiesterase class II)